MNKTDFQRKSFTGLIQTLKRILWMVILLVTSCTSITTRPEADLLGRWSPSAYQGGDRDYFQDLEFFEDGRLSFLGGAQPESDDAKYVIIAPGRMKLTLGDQSEVVAYEIREEGLFLYFQDGHNEYQRVVFTEPTLAPSPIVDPVATSTHTPVAIMSSETPLPVTPTQTESVADHLPSWTPTLLEPTIEQTGFITPTPKRYFPISSCVASQLRLGDSAFVNYDGGRNSLRDTPDTHPSDNIVGYIYPGEVVEIIDGPICNHDWVLWKVMTTRYEEAWTPETDGIEFWILPLTTRQLCPDTLASRLVVRGEAFVMEEYDMANFIRQSPSLSADIITRIQPGGEMLVLEGPVCNDASNWWKILALNSNITGWTRENDAGRYFLAPIP